MEPQKRVRGFRKMAPNSIQSEVIKHCILASNWKNLVTVSGNLILRLRKVGARLGQGLAQDLAPTLRRRSIKLPRLKNTAIFC